MPNTVLCGLYVIYFTFTGNQGGYSMFTKESSEVERGDKDSSSTQITGGRAVINSTNSTISIWDEGLQPDYEGGLEYLI